MENLDYKKLYKLQDKVMDVVFDCENIFYLTGGTCLSRFYQEKRYSDDLDFFTHDHQSFNRVIREIKSKLNNKFLVKEEVTSKDFIRLKINNLLQVDFVNDRVMRYKDIITVENGYVIDNCENILANKLTAVIGRDNAKDIFDIYLIDEFYDYDFKEMLRVSHDKAGFSDDELIIRLKTFPIFLLDSISLIDKTFLDGFDLKYKKLIEKIEKAMI